MGDLLTLILIIAGIVGAGILVSISALSRRVAELQMGLANMPSTPAMSEVAKVPDQNPLEGLHIAIQIVEDHQHAAFEFLLKEQLFSQDVADILVVREDDLPELWHRANPPDILIKGNLICNGYSEVYYTAEFTCSNREQAICTLIEKPPHGDRPTNLAIELIARLKKELAKVIDRDERRQAIRELKG